MGWVVRETTDRTKRSAATTSIKPSAACRIHDRFFRVIIASTHDAIAYAGPILAGVVGAAGVIASAAVGGVGKKINLTAIV